jgi:hypothetical protein
VIREEWSRLFTFEERHRRLIARLLLAFGLSIVVFGIGSVLVWWLESGQKEATSTDSVMQPFSPPFKC